MIQLSEASRSMLNQRITMEYARQLLFSDMNIEDAKIIGQVFDAISQ
jgi:hypothetical protein